MLIKWFHGVGESWLAEARGISDAHIRGDLDAHVLDLAIPEVGNVLARALRWTANDVGAQLDDLLAIVGSPEGCGCRGPAGVVERQRTK